MDHSRAVFIDRAFIPALELPYERQTINPREMVVSGPGRKSNRIVGMCSDKGGI